jgi:hypothetical protein
VLAHWDAVAASQGGFAGPKHATMELPHPLIVATLAS